MIGQLRTRIAGTGAAWASLTVFVIAIMALMAHSSREWDEINRTTWILQDRLHESRRLLATAALHTEMFLDERPAGLPELVDSTLERAVDASRELRDGDGRLAGFDLDVTLPARLREAVVGYAFGVERTAALLRHRRASPDRLPWIDVRRAIHDIDVRATDVQALLLGELSRQRRSQRLRDSGAIAMVALLSVALFALLAGLQRRATIALDQLFDSEAKLAAFVGNLPGLAIQFDGTGRCQAIYGSEDSIHGHSAAQLQGRLVEAIFPPDAAGEIRAAIERALHSKQSAFHQYRVYTDRAETTYQARIARVDGSDSVICLVSDVSELEQAQRHNRLLAAALESSNDGVMISDLKGRIASVNGAFTFLTGYRRDELVGRAAWMLRSNSHDVAFYRSLRRSLEFKGTWRGELWIRQKSGASLPVFMTVGPVRENGQTSHHVAAMTDLRQLKHAQARLDEMAHVDALTGLPNYTAMREHIERALSAANTPITALMLLDLDDFQRINAGFGRTAGDELLVGIAARLRNTIAPEAVLARLVSDTFAILVEAGSDALQLARLAEALSESFEAPFVLGGHQEVFIRARIGIAMSPVDGRRVDELLGNAETALSQCKREMQKSYVFYSEALTAEAGERIALEHRLRRALRNGAFKLRFQPVIDLASGRQIGAEVLVRLAPDKDLPIGPDRFIPVMEETGMILEMGEWVERAACRQLREWLDKGLEPGFLAINVSAEEIRRGRIAEQIREILAEYRLPPERIELEVTETALMEHGQRADELLRGIASIGVRIAIDDFGTGYSSLAYLKRFPLRKLKIDRSFIRDIPLDRGDMQLSATIIALGHGLDLTVVAEGVETEEQRDFLASLNCDAAQGYLYSRPLPADEFERAYLTG